MSPLEAGNMSGAARACRESSQMFAPHGTPENATSACRGRHTPRSSSSQPSVEAVLRIDRAHPMDRSRSPYGSIEPLTCLDRGRQMVRSRPSYTSIEAAIRLDRVAHMPRSSPSHGAIEPVIHVDRGHHMARSRASHGPIEPQFPPLGSYAASAAFSTLPSFLTRTLSPGASSATASPAPKSAAIPRSRAIIAA